MEIFTRNQVERRYNTQSWQQKQNISDPERVERHVFIYINVQHELNIYITVQICDVAEISHTHFCVKGCAHKPNNTFCSLIKHICQFLDLALVLQAMIVVPLSLPCWSRLKKMFRSKLRQEKSVKLKLYQ